MRPPDRAPADRVLVDRALREARLAAFPAGEYVDQESFVCASEVRSLAARAGVGPGTTVLDLCCGVGGPGRMLTRELGCRYRGVDASPDALALARERAADLPCEFTLTRVPPVPPGPFEVVLLLETLLAFRDKQDLLHAVGRALHPGGRFAATVEEGRPLSAAERRGMPDADTVWPVPLPELRTDLARAGLQVRWLEDHSASHRAVVDALLGAFTEHAPAITAALGHPVLDDLLASHRRWSEWLREGRVRKLALVAEKEPSP